MQHTMQKFAQTSQPKYALPLLGLWKDLNTQVGRLMDAYLHL